MTNQRRHHCIRTTICASTSPPGIRTTTWRSQTPMPKRANKDSQSRYSPSATSAPMKSLFRDSGAHHHPEAYWDKAVCNASCAFWAHSVADNAECVLASIGQLSLGFVQREGTYNSAWRVTFNSVWAKSNMEESQCFSLTSRIMPQPTAWTSVPNTGPGIHRDVLRVSRSVLEQDSLHGQKRKKGQDAT